MKKSISVFGSKAEPKAFATIEAHLPEGFGLYHNLPLSQIVEVERGELSVGDWDFYLKTSVDFILADRSDEPMLAIEFDGTREHETNLPKTGPNFKSASHHANVPLH